LTASPAPPKTNIFVPSELKARPRGEVSCAATEKESTKDAVDTSNGDLIVQDNSVLTIPAGVSLDIDFTNHNLTVKSGSGILIKAGGKIT